MAYIQSFAYLQTHPPLGIHGISHVFIYSYVTMQDAYVRTARISVLCTVYN